MTEPATIKLSIFGEFREFIARGNVIDLAVGVIIGAAFNDIVKSLVDNVVMPPIGLLLSGIDFAHLQWVLRPDDPATKANELVAIQYGLFFNTVIRFVIVAWVVFLLVKGVNAIRRKDAADAAPRRSRPRRPAGGAADGNPRPAEGASSHSFALAASGLHPLITAMGVQAKICGISTPEAVTAALEGGAAFLGFMFFEKSPRNVAPDAAWRLAQPVRGKAKVVAVLVDPSDAEVDRIAGILKPDLIQLHGAETPSRARAIGERAGAGIIKVVPVSEAADLAAAAQYETVVDYLMFDAKPAKDADRPGGGGNPFDWTLLAGHRFERPWLLAGGLDPWNLAEAVQASGARLVDVSSGVERGPGLKDPALIAAFLDAAKRA